MVNTSSIKTIIVACYAAAASVFSSLLGEILQFEAFGLCCREAILDLCAFVTTDLDGVACFVELFFAIFLRVATAFVGFAFFLRNKATLGSACFISMLSEFRRTAGVGALVRGHVTKIEGEILFRLFLLFAGAGLYGNEAFALETDRALRQPSGFSHLVDQFDFFLVGGRLDLGEGCEEPVEIGLRFVSEDVEFAGQAMAGRILRDDLLTCRTDRTMGELGVGAVGLQFALGNRNG